MASIWLLSFVLTTTVITSGSAEGKLDDILASPLETKTKDVINGLNLKVQQIQEKLDNLKSSSGSSVCGWASDSYMKSIVGKYTELSSKVDQLLSAIKKKCFKADHRDNDAPSDWNDDRQHNFWYGDAGDTLHN